MSKKVIVIGAGVAGMSAAYYSRQKGYEVTVFEQGNCSGGVATSWVRRGYTFDGGIHWLVGTSPRFQPFHKRWVETGALQVNNPVVYADPVFEFRSGDTTLHLWRDIDRLAQELADFAPEDRKAVLALRRHVRIIGTYMPAPQGFGDRLKQIYRLPVFVPLISRLIWTSTEKYIGRFKNPHIREMLSSILSLEQNALSLIGTLVGYTMGDNGYPTGGSRRLADNMEQTVLKAGCRIVYRTKVEKVCIENGRVKGVMVNGKLHPADYVIVAMDTCTALRTLFDKPLQERWARKLAKGMDSEHCSLLSLGVKKDLSYLPSTLRIHLKEPIVLAGRSYTTLWVYRYNGKEGYAPDGCSSLTVLFQGDTYDYWKAAKDDGTYTTRKQEFTQEVLRLLESYLPEITENVAVTDLATPITYERYCGCYRGGYMGMWYPKQQPYHAPVKSSTVRGLRFAGMRTFMSGGMPVSVQSGYKAAKSL
ncbi:MAG: NAD(P)/FAD-dependent oxidoreductase [Bacteroidaceae bacterium]|nr:NAD(P)/FAD-dependent oxidoreductase [Bacteroidaceae bacterium]